MPSSIKENIKKEYQKLNISEELIDKAINFSKSNGATSYDVIMFESKKYIDKNLIKKASCDIDLEILLIDKYRQLTFPILRKYSSILSKNDVNKIYEDAIERCFTDYNDKETLGKNILNHMLNIIKEEYIGEHKQEYSKKEITIDKNNNDDKKEDIFVKQEDDIQKESFSYQELITKLKLDFKDFKLQDKFYIETVSRLYKSSKDLQTIRKCIIDKIEDKYGRDIRFFDSYLDNNKINLNELSKFLEIDLQFIYGYIKLGKPVSDHDIKIIHRKLNYNSIYEIRKNIDLIILKLKSEIKKEIKIEDSDKKNNKKNIDISFLYEFVNTKDEMIKIAKALNTTISTLTYWLIGYKKMPYYFLDKLLNYYEVSSIEELKKKIEKKKNKQSFNEEKQLLIEPRSFINIEVLEKILEKYNIDSKEKIVVKLLFGDNNYTTKEIADITKLKEEIVLEVYKMCLKIYMETFKTSCEKIYSFKERSDIHDRVQYNK